MNDIKTRKTFPEILFFAAKITLFVFAIQPASRPPHLTQKIGQKLQKVSLSFSAVKKVEIYEE